MNDLSGNKAAGGDTPLNLLKESTFILPYFVHCVNEALMKSEFPDPLQLFYIVPVRKKRILMMKKVVGLSTVTIQSL